MESLEAINNNTGKTERVQIEKNCIFTHKGKVFGSGGAFVSERFIYGYLAKNKDTGTLEIQDWHGKTVISDKVLIISKRTDKYGEVGYYLRFLHDGKVYAGFKVIYGDLVRAKLTTLRRLDER